MKDALAIHRTLLEHEKPHEIVRLPHAIASADELPGALGVAPDRCLAVWVFGIGRSGPQAGPEARAGYGAGVVARPRAGAVTGAGPETRGTPRTSSGFAAVIVAAGAQPATAAVRAAAGVRRAVPASPRAVNLVTDYAAPLVAPLLLPAGLPVLLDRRVTDRLGPDELVYTATGEPWTALRIQAGDLIALSRAVPVELRSADGRRDHADRPARPRGHGRRPRHAVHGPAGRPPREPQGD